MDTKGKYTYDWPRPMVTVDAVVFAFSKENKLQKRAKTSQTRVLLIQRKNEPFKGMWALPGGFINIDEELEDAVARELAEETSLTDVVFEQIGTFGKCGRDPRGRTISIVFMGIIQRGLSKIKAGDDAAKARWFYIEKLPRQMAFDHNEIIREAVKKLKSKKVYKMNIKRS